MLAVKNLVVTVVALCLALPLFAWGEKGHYICSEAATFSLPTDMPTFFYKSYPELIFLAYDPDRWRGAGDSLDAVKQLVRVGAFVNSAAGFNQQPAVANGASDLFVEVFGDAGRHARTAIGVNELPAGFAVEVELVAEI